MKQVTDMLRGAFAAIARAITLAKALATAPRALLAAALILAGCNLYNPSGEGDSSSNPLAQGDELYRQRDFGGAMRAYTAAIAADSNNSLAYYGYAKATARFYKLDNLALLNDLEQTQSGASFSFIQGYSDSELTSRMQAAARVRRTLALLTDRDTLSRWYGYLKDSTSRTARADTLRDARIAFIRDYLAQADAGTGGYRVRARFPLTDFRMPYDKVIVDFTAFEMMYLFTSKLRDLDQNDTIDARDGLMTQLNFGKGNGGFAIDSLSKIAGDLESDPVATENLNGVIKGMQSGLVDVSLLAQLISFSSASDTAKGSAGADQKTSSNIDSVINSLGDAIVFYQFGDQLDNDGDGCIDEEVLDDKDNDGDGFVDEDARITVLTLFETADNDHNGKVNDSGLVTTGRGTLRLPLEDKIGSANITGTQTDPNLLAFVHQFYVDHPDSAGKFIKIHKGDPAMALRVKIQKDSLSLPSRRNLANYAQKLDSAKALVGGCWRNYTAPVAGKRARF